MISVYAIVLIAGVSGLIAWIFSHVAWADSPRRRLDPEERFGVAGRRLVAALVGFGIAGLSAEYSPRDIPWPLGLVLAAAAASALAWYAGRALDDGRSPAVRTPDETTD